MTDVRSSEWDVTSAGDLRQNSERNAQKALEMAGVQAKRENHREIFIRLERPLPEDVSEELYLQNQKWAKGVGNALCRIRIFPVCAGLSCTTAAIGTQAALSPTGPPTPPCTPRSVQWQTVLEKK